MFPVVLRAFGTQQSVHRQRITDVPTAVPGCARWMSRWHRCPALARDIFRCIICHDEVINAAINIIVSEEQRTRQQ